MSNVAMMVDRTIGITDPLKRDKLSASNKYKGTWINTFLWKGNCMLGVQSILLGNIIPILFRPGSASVILIVIIGPCVVSSPIILFYDEICGVCMPRGALKSIRQAYSYVLFLMLFLFPSICRFSINI